MREPVQTFEPFAGQHAYIRVNEKLVDRILKRLPERKRYQLLDIAAGTGLMTRVAHLRARVIGAEIDSVLLDIDLPALREARREACRALSRATSVPPPIACPLRRLST